MENHLNTEEEIYLLSEHVYPVPFNHGVNGLQQRPLASAGDPQPVLNSLSCTYLYMK
ncbi:hypothetical protein ACIFQM_17835 [Paenibacillus sp. NRS-1782]|uniref:hypothetical protein n=1 Tax=unclassified Paenibacillus TaxID=185978 RepID=UPI003D2BEED6